MYLKNVTLKGFKSFKDKNRLFFEPGVSVVVGPNGSGKSNIADAISWVLGEQSPKTLRGNSMADVIFRSKKEEMGIAEVSLLFDNSNRVFDTEFRDVKFTRRVYSKGGSEYYINSSPCRLADIQDLTAESGIGKGLNVIINQGQVNEIAVLKPEERKEIIDEVLGISGHKSRRDKSLVKLQKVKDDINRIDDLMEEIKRTMDPLEVEAKRARRYSELFNLLKNEEVSLFIANLNRLNERWDKENESYKKNRDKLEGIKKKISFIEKEKRELREYTVDERNDYEMWKNRIELFNDEINNLKNLAALSRGKKNVFKTLWNMFDIEVNRYAGSKNAAGSLSAGNTGKGLAQSIEKVSERLDKVTGLLQELMDNLKKMIKDNKTFIYTEGKIKSIMGEIEKLNGIVENEIRYSNKKISGKPKQNNNKDTGDINKEIERIRSLKNICSINLRRSEKIYSILKDYLSVSESFKKKLYPEFKKRNALISKNSEKINNLEKEINDLNLQKSNLENSLNNSDLKKEQVRERVKIITENIVDNYNISTEYALRSYSPSPDIKKAEIKVRKLKSEIRSYGNVNPNAAIEYGRIKKRFDFLAGQRIDLIESKKDLEELIKDINRRITDYFYDKFEEIKKCFRDYFKILFPLGEGEIQIEKRRSGQAKNGDEIGVDLKADIGNSKFVNLSLLSGGEKSLVSMVFLFSIYSINPSPFYVFDEVDAALDDVNIARFLTLVKKFSEKQQIVMITHQKKTMEIADTIYGVTMQPDGVSRIVSEKIKGKYAEVN
ncbi:MAG: AAA family ATPase [Actinomycetota bacterium]|nr:AAA family ATPase [Actinomycetota bacterium]